MARFAISDIHGCQKTFEALLDKVGFTKADTLYLLGDYIHRGPDSIGVVENILKMQKSGYQVHCLMGNHEDMALAEILQLRDGQIKAPLDTFVKELLLAYGSVPGHFYRFILDLPSMLRLDDYILVHAGFDFKHDNPFYDVRAMRWIRDWYQNINYAFIGNATILHGHTPIKPSVMDQQFLNLDKNRYLDIDGGCVFNTYDNYIGGYGYLCAFNMDERTLVKQVCVD